MFTDSFPRSLPIVERRKIFQNSFLLAGVTSCQRKWTVLSFTCSMSRKYNRIVHSPLLWWAAMVIHLMKRRKNWKELCRKLKPFTGITTYKMCNSHNFFLFVVWQSQFFPSQINMSCLSLMVEAPDTAITKFLLRLIQSLNCPRMFFFR